MLGFEQGRDRVGKGAIFMVYGWFFLESAKDQFLVVDPQDNMCHHVSSIE
jgi:hypothetical protein